jgi:heptaprenyl diphosphate synthase
VRELQTVFDVGRTEDAYAASIAGKTASLFAAACRIGGIVGGLDRPAIEAVTAYGHAYGMAFQVVDDVLDVVATEEQLGKPSGHDMAEGVYTLPVIRALAAGDDAAVELRELLGRPLQDDVEIERARKLVKAGGAVDEAVAAARTYGDEAVAALASLPASGPAEALAAAATGLVDSIPS